MSQLYELKRGGSSMGSFEEAWEENLIIIMEFLTLAELISFASRLGTIRQVYSNDNQHLEEATKIFSKSNQLSVNKLNAALKTIAEVTYIKIFNSDETLEEATDEIVEDLKKQARRRGYKED